MIQKIVWFWVLFLAGLANAQSAGNADEALNGRLAMAADNRGQLEDALRRVPAEQAHALHFLIENMPEADLRNLDADFLLEHIALAFRSRQEANWGADIPVDIFLNEVLPYANVNEKRDDVRRELRDRFWPSVKHLESPALAAAVLNQQLFKELNVQYSTKRRRADQGPRESMESGLASCTGLSILLIDTCRACGIPARFVGTPLWSDGSGNHSWVEVWDGQWHFTGAAEPTGNDLDKAWFVERAAKATPGEKHGIFAASFRRTEQRFPLVWLPRESEVYAVEVTERYARTQPAKPDYLDIGFRTLGAVESERCVANLVVRDAAGQVVFRGQTKDERADANDHLMAQLPPGNYSVEVESNRPTNRMEFTASATGQVVSLAIDQTPADDPLEQLRIYCQAHPDVLPEQLSLVAEESFAQVALSRQQTQAAVEILWDYHLRLMQASRREEHASQRLVSGQWELKYTSQTFGEPPKNGHSLTISMHGGGGAPKAVNDQQWENQKKLYQLEEGIYVAPRGPSDTWNLWHQAHIDDLFTRLIANMIVFEGVDPNRVYITGYSAGGDGVYQLAPRMADQLAAAAMMAGHPNETQALGLRNLPFTLHVGEKDSAYDRNQRAAQWGEALQALQAADPAGYTHWAKIHPGKPHWMNREDAEGVRWMAQFTRNVIPERVVWLQDDVTHDRFYWLAVEPGQARERTKIIAHRRASRVTIESSDVDALTILLRDDMLDLDQPVSVTVGDKRVFKAKANRTIANLARTLADRGDPQAIFSACIKIEGTN